MADNQLKIQMIALLDDSQFQDKMKNVISGLDTVKTKHKDVFDSLKEGWMAVVGVIAAVVIAFKAAIDESIKMSEANNNLNASLRSTGQYTKDVSNGIKEWASNLSELTGIEDEVIINLTSMAIKQGLSTDQAKLATQTAIGLSKALGIDQNEALKMVMQAHSGVFTQMSRSIPAMRDLTDNTEKMALMNKIASGGLDQIANDMNTAEGSIKKSDTAMRELKTSLGDIILTGIKPFIDFFTMVITVLNKAPAPIKTVIEILIIATTVIISATVAAKGFGIAMSTALGPISIITLAVTGLIAAGIEIKKHWTEIGNFFINLWGDIKVLVLEAIKGIMDGLATFEAPFIKLVDLIIMGLNKIRGTHLQTLSEMKADQDKHFLDMIAAQKTANAKTIQGQKDMAAAAKKMQDDGLKSTIAVGIKMSAEDAEYAKKKKALIDEILKYKMQTDNQLQQENIIQLEATLETDKKEKEERKKLLDSLVKDSASLMSNMTENTTKALLIQGTSTKDVLKGMLTDTGNMIAQILLIKSAAAFASMNLVEGGLEAAGAGIVKGLTAAAVASFAVGTNNVPYDMVANVHKGERIIPASMNNPNIQNNSLRGVMMPSGGAGGVVNNNSSISSNTVNQNNHINVAGMTIDDVMKFAQRTGTQIFQR